MKILLISFLMDLDFGGAPSVVYNLSRGLVKSGHSVTILTSHPQAKYETEDMDGIKTIRVYPQNLYWIADKDRQPSWKKIIWQLMDTWNPLTFQTIKKILLQEKPDLIHTHKLRGFSPSAWTAGNWARIPVIHTAHDFELISPQGTLSGIVGRMADRRSILIRPYQAIRARASRSVRAFTAPSKFVLDGHHKCGFFPRSILQMIPNSSGFPSPDTLDRVSITATQTGKPYRFLYLGRLETEKGIDRLCQRFDRVSRRIPGLRLKIGGTGSLEGGLRATYAGNPTFEFCGWLASEDKLKALNECDFVVVPSICQEAFGITVVEAFAAGKPVLASRIGGLAEIVQDGVNGFLVDPFDDEAWETALWQAANLVNMESLRLAVRNSASGYTFSGFMNSFIQLYEKVLSTSFYQS